jgi:hypothetical protein
MQTFTFRRWALNRSWSNRMAKIGKPLTGTLNDAIKYARTLGETEGEVFIFDNDLKVAEVSEFRYQHEDCAWVQIRVRNDYIDS